MFQRLNLECKNYIIEHFQNWPVYVACTESESEMQWRVHTALDVAEDRLAAGARASDLRDLYLGLLYSTEAHNM